MAKNVRVLRSHKGSLGFLKTGTEITMTNKAAADLERRKLVEILGEADDEATEDGVPKSLSLTSSPKPTGRVGSERPVPERLREVGSTRKTETSSKTVDDLRTERPAAKPATKTDAKDTPK